MDKEKLQLLKKKHGDIYTLTVKTDDKEYVAYLRRPTRDEYFAYFSFVSSNNILKGFDVLLRTCMIEGDSEIVDDDKVYLTALNQIAGLVDLYEGELKKN